MDYLNSVARSLTLPNKDKHALNFKPVLDQLSETVEIKAVRILVERQKGLLLEKPRFPLPKLSIKHSGNNPIAKVTEDVFLSSNTVSQDPLPHEFYYNKDEIISSLRARLESSENKDHYLSLIQSISRLVGFFVKASDVKMKLPIQATRYVNTASVLFHNGQSALQRLVK